MGQSMPVLVQIEGIFEAMKKPIFKIRYSRNLQISV